MTPANDESTVRCARATVGEWASSTEAPSHASVVRNTTFNMRRPGLLFTELVGNVLRLIAHHMVVDVPRGRAEKYDRNVRTADPGGPAVQTRNFRDGLLASDRDQSNRDRGADNQQRDRTTHRRHWRDDEFSPPPRRDDLGRCLRQRVHDLRLEIRRRMCPTSSLDFDVDVFPKLDVSSRITLPHASLRKFSIQPRVHRRREHAYILFLVT